MVMSVRPGNNHGGYLGRKNRDKPRHNQDFWVGLPVTSSNHGYEQKVNETITQSLVIMMILQMTFNINTMPPM
jgi:hypothetical protein